MTLQQRGKAILAVLWGDRQEITVAAGVLLLSCGIGALWSVAAGCIAAGGLMLWTALPSRDPFIAKPVTPMQIRKRSD